MSATNRGAVRNERDFYATPKAAFIPLMKYLPTGIIWEPACGDGRLVSWMRDGGFKAEGSDLEPQCDAPRLDFLETSKDFPAGSGNYAAIVTNPPFSLAFEFCQHARKLSDETFFLLSLNFLASRKRNAWFKANLVSALFVLSARPSFTANGKTDACDYAWFYWGPRHRGIFHL